MRDVYCPKCGDPCENDYLHDVANDAGVSYLQVFHDFQSRGCVAVGFSCNSDADEFRASAMSAMFDVMGDDVDAAINMMEDFGF